MSSKTKIPALQCAHCGASSGDEPVLAEEKVFCCNGCKSVYLILKEGGLCDYYNVGGRPFKPNSTEKQDDSAAIWNLMKKEFTLFESEDRVTVLLYIPSMHCSSCIWLLEKLPQLEKGITASRVDFGKKQLTVSYKPKKTNFGLLVALLISIGYAPSLIPEESKEEKILHDRKNLSRLGVAGFCAGNIMLFSFPQYLGLDSDNQKDFAQLFNMLNLGLSIPLVFYGAGEYIKSFFTAFRLSALSVKVPLALGMGTLWLRSVYEILSGTGIGYFDSLAGLVFFLLLGTWLQNRTFDHLRFGEKARHFFPLVANIKTSDGLSHKKVSDLTPGDRLWIKTGEIIPADAILMSVTASVDYAFVTGESTPAPKVAGEMVYGGGRNAGDAIELEVIKSFEQGRFNEIWKSAEQGVEHKTQTPEWERKISAVFLIATLAIALLTCIYGVVFRPENTWFPVVAVLMVACPCALALAPPFAYNIVANKLASMGLFLRKTEVVGILGDAKNLVFDKTGTLTDSRKTVVVIPDTYTLQQKEMLHALASCSNHPISRVISGDVTVQNNPKIESFSETAGCGTQGYFSGHKLKLGNAAWVGRSEGEPGMVYISVDDNVLPGIMLRNAYRAGLTQTLQSLKDLGVSLQLSTGDNNNQKANVTKDLGPWFDTMWFQQLPGEKAALVQVLRRQGKTIMVGDGLNDAGALKAGDVGMVITENTNNFTPEADAILLANSINQLPEMLMLAKKANRVVKETFFISLIYNAAALTLAVVGELTPLIAAIIMPAGSSALMLYAWGRSRCIVKGANS